MAYQETKSFGIFAGITLFPEIESIYDLYIVAWSCLGIVVGVVHLISLLNEFMFFLEYIYRIELLIIIRKLFDTISSVA